MSHLIVNIFFLLGAGIAALSIIFRRRGWSWMALVFPWILFAAACLIQRSYVGFWINISAFVILWTAVGIRLRWFRLRHRTEITITIAERSTQSDERL